MNLYSFFQGDKHERRGVLEKTSVSRRLSKHDVPQLFHASHTESGFRPMHQPWSYYFYSIFSLHNESLNIWTHLIPLILVIRKTLTFSVDLDFASDPYAYPLLTGLLSAAIVFLCSSIAHCYHSKSVFVHYLLFMFDYFGIAQYALGSGIIHLFYSSDDDYYHAVQPYFLPAGIVLPTTICYCCIVSKLDSDLAPVKKKLYRILPITVTYIAFNMPVFTRLFTCYWSGDCCDPSTQKHFIQVVSFVISGFFFASDIPQKWSPGKYDYFLHSHQLFHVAIAVCILAKMDAVKMDFETNESVIRKRRANDYIEVLLPYAVVMVMMICCVIYYAVKIHRNLQGSTEFRKKHT